MKYLLLMFLFMSCEPSQTEKRYQAVTGLIKEYEGTVKILDEILQDEMTKESKFATDVMNDVKASYLRNIKILQHEADSLLVVIKNE